MIIKNELTVGLTCIAHCGNGKILVGTKTGVIRLWKYSRPATLTHIRDYSDDEVEIRLLISYSTDNFIAINKLSQIKVWSLDSRTPLMTLPGIGLENIWSAVVITNNLLVVSGDVSPAWMAFDVWDLGSGSRLYGCNQYCHRPRFIELAETVQGFLVAAGHCVGGASVWKIDRAECRAISKNGIPRIYSMAVLPSGEVVFGNHNLHFYKISADEGKLDYWKTIQVGNVIDEILPVGGYKLITVDRRLNSGVVRLWNFMTEDCQWLGNSCIGERTARGHVLLDRESAVLAFEDNEILIREFAEGLFHFPKQLAELRKNARILFQARETEASCFGRLPKEIIIRILMLTCDGPIDCDRKVIRRIAENHFSRPAQICM